jgi:undecaprenyl diphosphate synthase
MADSRTTPPPDPRGRQPATGGAFHAGSGAGETPAGRAEAGPGMMRPPTASPGGGVTPSESAVDAGMVRRFPGHLAIVIDGNGRWARLQGVDRAEGHIAGAEAVRRVVKACAMIGEIRQLTLFAFSPDVFDRPTGELQVILRVLRKFAVRERQFFQRYNIAFVPIGKLDALPRDLLRELERTADETAGNTGMVLTPAINYCAREEMAEALRQIGQSVLSGELDPEDICGECLEQRLYLPKMPPVDLLLPHRRTTAHRQFSAVASSRSRDSAAADAVAGVQGARPLQRLRPVFCAPANRSLTSRENPAIGVLVGARRVAGYGPGGTAGRCATRARWYTDAVGILAARTRDYTRRPWAGRR